jgi:hypothetical protein
VLKIDDARFVVRDVHPNLRVEEDQVTQVCACALTITVGSGASAILQALQLGPLASALHAKNGRPQLEWADIVTRYKLPNVALKLTARDLFGGRSVDLRGCTLGRIKVVATAGHGLELHTTVDSPISSQELAQLFDLRMASDIRGSVEQQAGSAALPQS